MAEEFKPADKADLGYTNELRKDIVNKLVGGGIPDDPKLLGIALKALDGIDKQALTVMKIESDEGINDKNLQAAANISHILSTKTVKQLMGETTIDNPGQIVEFDPALIGLDVQVVPGELDQISEQMNYEKFMAATEPVAQ